MVTRWRHRDVDSTAMAPIGADADSRSEVQIPAQSAGKKLLGTRVPPILYCAPPPANAGHCGTQEETWVNYTEKISRSLNYDNYISNPSIAITVAAKES